jgi:hypothetical protein
VGTRSTATLGDVVAALLDAREAPATMRFDAVLAAAVAAGSVDPEVARALRWWQRQSVREATDHARTVLPPALAALAEAAAGARAATTAADEAWRAAGGRDPLEDAPATEAAAPAQPAPAQPAATAAPAMPTDRTPRETAPADAAQSRRRLVVAGLTRTG